MIAEMAKKHSSEVFYALDDPPVAVVFSVLIKAMKTKPVIEESSLDGLNVKSLISISLI